MKFWLYPGLAVLTLLSTALAGVQWLNLNPFELENLARGIPYALAVCFILLSHEMGHYIAARVHGVETTFPLFLPFPAFLVGGMLSFGTLGAVIRIKSVVPSRKALFDIGVAGPIAGFAASLVVLVAGYQFLPPISFLHEIHPDYTQMDQVPQGGLTFGTPLVVFLAQKIIPGTNAFVPPMNEIYHYPLLCGGWFGMLLTALNLLPVGQLDGGHIATAVAGKTARRLGGIVVVVLASFGILGIAPYIGIDWHLGWPGWLVWAAILRVMIWRLPPGKNPATDEAKIDRLRIAIAIACVAVFLMTFTLSPVSIE
jgi:membrane-associated protease RseP (regulator of RpoE activity)